MSVEPTMSAEDEAEINTMNALALKHGYVCSRSELWEKEFGIALGLRMVQRLGSLVYQMFAYHVTNMPKTTLVQLLPAACVTEETTDVTTWTMESLADVAPSVTSAMIMSGFVCAGSTKAFQTKSQPFIRVVAKLMAPLKISHVVLASGVEKTYVNGMYALVTENGEIHWPKNEKRQEIWVDDSEEAELRKEVLADVQLLAVKGHSLSPGWWRQLGNEEKALEVEASLANPKRSLAPAKKAKKIKAPKRRRFTKETYEIEEIVAERKTSTKSKREYLVRWSGYNSEVCTHRTEPHATHQHP